MSPVVEAQWLERLQTRVETTGTKQRFLRMTGTALMDTQPLCLAAQIEPRNREGACLWCFTVATTEYHGLTFPKGYSL